MHEFNNQKPIFLQLKEIIEKAILDDLVKPDEPIPSIRGLAHDYQLNPLTVNNAISELYSEGVIYKKRGIGMFVSVDAKEKIRNAQLGDFSSGELVNTIQKAKLLGMKKEEVDQVTQNIYGGNNDE